MQHKKRILLISIAIILLIALGFIFINSRFNVFPQLYSSWNASSERFQFPDIKKEELTLPQQNIVSILEREYAAQPSGTKYSEGVQEPWCADFVSWIYKQAGISFKNPNSGSWRIPGTYTLREYYESKGKFRSARSDYQPKVGDIMLYDNPSQFGQHTNIVIKTNKDIITTVGGNEPGGIRVFQHKEQGAAGFIGYGEL